MAITRAAPPEDKPPEAAPPGHVEEYELRETELLSPTGPGKTDAAGRPDIPEFPWPPPAASAQYVIPKGILPRPDEDLHYLGDVDSRLTDAINACGYSERYYYAVPEGFALVTRLEQINEDGTSKAPPERWAPDLEPLHTFSLKAYLKALFMANPGLFRVFVFVVTPLPFGHSGAGISKDEIDEWTKCGLNTLPPEIGHRPFTADCRCTVLVYEFEQSEPGAEATQNLPSSMDGRTHLYKALVWQELTR